MKKYLISDPLIREAIYLGYRGKCFYTGREVPKEMMEIDHLVPVSKGGPDSIDNYVLTCKETNRVKRDKIERSMIERMQYLVKIVFVPRVMRKLEELKCKSKRISKKTIRLKKSKNLVCVGLKDLYWGCDSAIKILANSELVTVENFLEIGRLIDKYTEIAIKHSNTFCDDAWLTKDFIKQIKSLWYEVNNRLIKLVDKAIFYEEKSFEGWGTIYFNNEYIAFIKELKAEDERYNEYCDIDKEDEYWETIYEKFPPPQHLVENWGSSKFGATIMDYKMSLLETTTQRSENMDGHKIGSATIQKEFVRNGE